MIPKLCIATVVSGEYLWYIPLFNYCLKKAYPEYDILIYIEEYSELPPEYRENCGTAPWVFKSDNGYRTATKRFLLMDELKEYEYVLITDIDIMHFAETPKILEYHLSNMAKYGTECYDNYISADGQMPGVHFVTKDWWDKTKDIRKKYLFNLGTCVKDDDEKLLYSIVSKSGLPMPERRGSGGYHGLHLGRFRDKNFKYMEGTVGAKESQMLKTLLLDAEFMELVEMAGKHSPIIKGVFALIKKLIYIPK